MYLSEISCVVRGHSFTEELVRKSNGILWTWCRRCGNKRDLVAEEVSA